MKYHHLTEPQRSQIYVLKSTGLSQKKISELIGISASTISRELSRNTGQKGYRYKQAQKMSIFRRYIASSTPKSITPQLLDLIESKLKLEWSPVQISGTLKENNIFISHERIYQHIRADRRNGGTLYKHLRHKGKKYKYKYKASQNTGRGSIPNRVDIKERPTIVEKKSRIGDWEGDTIIGKNHKGAILSLVDRKSKYTLLSLLKAKTSQEVITGTKTCFERVPRRIIHTCTYDNGKEFSGHEAIAKMLDAKSYFATPYRSCERGLNEHTNGLVRQYLPKKTQFTTLEAKDVQFIEDRLNNRPRKVLGFRTPREVLLGIKRPARIALHC